MIHSALHRHLLLTAAQPPGSSSKRDQQQVPHSPQAVGDSACPGWGRSPEHVSHVPTQHKRGSQHPGPATGRWLTLSWGLLWTSLFNRDRSQCRSTRGAAVHEHQRQQEYTDATVKAARHSMSNLRQVRLAMRRKRLLVPKWLQRSHFLFCTSASPSSKQISTLTCSVKRSELSHQQALLYKGKK